MSLIWTKWTGPLSRQPWHIPFINLYHGGFGGNKACSMQLMMSDVNCLGTGHYLSPGVGVAEEFGGITWFLGERKGGSVVTENPREGGGVTENFGRIQRGDRWNLLGKWRHGGGGSRRSSNVIKGDHFSEVTFKGGSGKFIPCSAQNPPPSAKR